MNGLDRPTLKIKSPHVLPAEDLPEAKPIPVLPARTRETKRLYLVMCEGGDFPQKVHLTQGSAKGEAMRLALMYPDHQFHVLISWRCYAVNGG